MQIVHRQEMIEFTISAPEDRLKVIQEIKDLPEGKWTVKIYPWAQKKTTAQNRLLWKWNTEISKVWGWLPEEVHEFLKEKFLLNILYREKPGFARMADSIRNIRQYSKDDYDFIRAQVIALVSTTKLEAPWMSEYLTKIKIFCHHEGIRITIPHDREMEWLCGISEEKTD